MSFNVLELEKSTYSNSRYSPFYVKGERTTTVFRELVEEVIQKKNLQKKELARIICVRLKKDNTTIEKFIYDKNYFPSYLIIHLINELDKERQEYYFEEFNKTIMEVKSGASGNWMKFPKELSKDIAWLSGAIAADGWITIGKKGKERIGLVDQYSSSIELAQKKFEDVFGYRPRVFKHKKDNAWILICDNNVIVRFFIEYLKHDSGYKTDKVVEPIIIKNSPFRLDFAKGVLIFDGSAELSGVISLGMLSRSIVKDVYEILRENGFTISLTQRRKLAFLKSKSIFCLENPEKWIELFDGTKKAKRLSLLLYGFKESPISKEQKITLLTDFIGKSNSHKYEFSDLLDYLYENHHARRKDIVKHFGYAHATMYNYWRILTLANIIKTVKVGRELTYEFNQEPDSWKIPIC